MHADTLGSYTVACIPLENTARADLQVRVSLEGHHAFGLREREQFISVSQVLLYINEGGGDKKVSHALTVRCRVS